MKEKSLRKNLTGWGLGIVRPIFETVPYPAFWALLMSSVGGILVSLIPQNASTTSKTLLLFVIIVMTTLMLYSVRIWGAAKSGE